MIFKKQMVLTGYKIQYVDRRDPRPRTVHEEVFVMDCKWIEALNLIHIDIVDYIREKYARNGYAVSTVERINARRRVSVDLQQLWEDAEPSPSVDTTNQFGAAIIAEICAPEESEVTPNAAC